MNDAQPLRLSDIPALQAKIDREEQERWRDMLIASRPDLRILPAVPYENMHKLPQAKTTDIIPSTRQPTRQPLCGLRERENTGLQEKRTLGEDEAQCATQGAGSRGSKGALRHNAETELLREMPQEISQTTTARTSSRPQQSVSGDMALSELSQGGTFACRDLVLAESEVVDQLPRRSRGGEARESTPQRTACEVGAGSRGGGQTFNA
jgi:hypothetical protein